MALQDDERDRRVGLWSTLRGLDWDDVPAAILCDLGIYGGAQGIWVDKARTGPIHTNGAGVTVSVLHTGRHYLDDISEDGLIYHYPSTARPLSRDASEVEATKNADQRARVVGQFPHRKADHYPPCAATKARAFSHAPWSNKLLWVPWGNSSIRFGSLAAR
jgi:hypothetical protein